MDLARQSVVKSVDRVKKNVSGNVNTKNAQRNVDPSATDHCVNRNVAKPWPVDIVVEHTVQSSVSVAAAPRQNLLLTKPTLAVAVL